MAKFRVGDLVQIVSGSKWNGLVCKVTDPVDRFDIRPGPELEPLSERPDGLGSARFVWWEDELRKVEGSAGGQG